MSPEIEEELLACLGTLMHLISDEVKEIPDKREQAIETLGTCASIIATVTCSLVSQYFRQESSYEFLEQIVIPGMKNGNTRVIAKELD